MLIKWLSPSPGSTLSGTIYSGTRFDSKKLEMALDSLDSLDRVSQVPLEWHSKILENTRSGTRSSDRFWSHFKWHSTNFRVECHTRVTRPSATLEISSRVQHSKHSIECHTRNFESSATLETLDRVPLKVLSRPNFSKQQIRT